MNQTIKINFSFKRNKKVIFLPILMNMIEFRTV